MKKIISILYDGILIRIDQSSERLDWRWKHAPIGMVKYTPRKGSDKWSYVYFGQHDEACLHSANQHANREIKELQSKIKYLESQLVTKENTHSQHGVVK